MKQLKEITRIEDFSYPMFEITKREAKVLRATIGDTEPYLCFRIDYLWQSFSKEIRKILINKVSNSIDGWPTLVVWLYNEKSESTINFSPEELRDEWARQLLKHNGYKV